MKNHIILICFILGLSILILFFIATSKPTHTYRKTKSNICRGYLTDKEYLEHMIPHHQVAIDMSKVLLKNTKNDFMIYLANRIIRSQNAETILLNNMLMKNSYSHKSELII